LIHKTKIMQKYPAQPHSLEISFLNVISIANVLLAITSLVVTSGGFKVSADVREAFDLLDWFISAFFIVEYYIRWWIAGFKLSYLKTNGHDFALIFLFFLLPLPFLKYSQNPFIAHNIDETVMAKLYIIGNLVSKGVSLWQRIAKIDLKPSFLVITSFLLLILTGTWLLLLPGATVKPEGISITDAVFTAASATCLTGLTMVDIGSSFSRFGQIVILSLIQIGGIGLMTVVIFFLLILGKEMNIREITIISNIINARSRARVPLIILSTFALTLVFEVIGTLLLYVAWSDVGSFDHGSVLYYSIFHSISSFCNSGFTLFQDSFLEFRDNILFNVTTIALIIIGGLGFAVIINVIKAGIFKNVVISLHTKFVFTVTLSLIAISAIIILIVEWFGSLYELPVINKIISACFMAVTARTAGFTTINMGDFSFACQFMIIFLMFIGASPGGTGGGIKTSTFGVFISYVWSTLKGRNLPEIFKRTIPKDIVNNALTLIILSFIFISVFGFAILFVEKGDMFDILFELFSAFGNVGLSLGVTPNLTTLGKIIIMMTMLAGKVGTLTLVLAISQIRQLNKNIAYEYTEEDVTIG